MSQIKAKIIADSYSAINGKRITTFELQYPRFIHSELMTHRLFSRNAMSSRAVPIEKMIEQVQNDPAKPIHWGKNQSGMQAKEQLEGFELDIVQALWENSANEVSHTAKQMSKQGAHKQIVNRILEPFQLMKTVLTATEFDNFFWLRRHEDAQPEIKELAERMWEALEDNFDKQVTMFLSPGDWHTPYYGGGYWISGVSENSLEDALAISSSCCAQVSYRLLDDSIEKARKVYQRLVESKPVHASPFEHQATPIEFDGANTTNGFVWEEGVTSIDRNGDFWSGNFKSWIQYRQLIDGNVCNEYKE